MKKIISKLLPVALLPVVLGGCFNKEDNNVQTIPTGNVNTGVNTGTRDIFTGMNELTGESAEIMKDFNDLINGKEPQSSILSGKFEVNEIYATPAGQQTVKGNVLVQDNIVKAVNVELTAKDDVSKQFQTKFKDSISGKIVGKNINDVDVKFVNGSSLTATAFNNALKKFDNSDLK